MGIRAEPSNALGLSGVSWPETVSPADHASGRRPLLRISNPDECECCCCCRQVMKESRGRANPAELNRLLMQTLDAGQ